MQGNTVSTSQFEQYLFRNWVLHQNRTGRQHHKKSGLPDTGETAFLENAI
jgi:hypothetical protein